MSRPSILGSGGFAPRGLAGGAATPVQQAPAPPKKPGTSMPPDEWQKTAAIRRELVERLGHLEWSKMTVEQCDDEVRRVARERGVL